MVVNFSLHDLKIDILTKCYQIISEVFHCVNCLLKFVTVLDVCIGNTGLCHIKCKIWVIAKAGPSPDCDMMAYAN